MLIGAGLARYATHGAPAITSAPASDPLVPLTAILVLRAFASGAVALTGIEAVADGVTAFKPPEVRNARTVLAVLGAIMVTLFVGTTALADLYDVVVLPEFIPARWWQQLLHNQTALLIKGAMLFRKNVVVTDVPYQLRD